MKKLIILLLLLVMVSSIDAVDRTGRDNTVILQDYVDGIYYWTAGFLAPNSRNELYDSTWVKFTANESRLETADRYPVSTERRDTIAITSGTEWYALNDDFSDVIRVTAILDGTGLETAMTEIDPQAAGKVRQTGNVAPKHWIVSRPNIQFIPANNDSDTVIVYYSATANELTALTDTCNIDIEYKLFAILRAAEVLMSIKASGVSSLVQADRLEFVQEKLLAEEKRLNERNKTVLEVIPK